MKKLEKMVKKAVVSMIDIEIYGWPPVCIGMLYQPERPTERPDLSLEANNTSEASNYKPNEIK